MATSSQSRLVRGIYRWDLLAVAVNGIVGAGIFGLPSQVYRYTGSYSVVVFIVCAVLIGTIVVCFAEVGGRFSESGGPYLYARSAFSPIVSFQVGWLVWLARITAFGAICNLLVDYVGYLWPHAVAGWWRFSIVSIIVIGLVVFNVTGVRRAAVLSNTLVIAKLLPILLFIVVGLFFIRTENFLAAPSPGFRPFSRAVLLSVFTFSGFEYAAFVAGETRDPRNNLPFVTLASVAVCSFLFVLIQFVCVGTLPGLAISTRPVADAGRQFLGPVGGLVITIGAIVSMLGTLNIIMLAAPRLLFAMAEQSQFPGLLKSIHPRFRTPHVAIIVSAVCIFVFTISGTFASSLTLTTITRILTYAATCAALIVLRSSRNVSPTTFRLPFGIVIAVLALALCSWLLALSSWREVRDVGIVSAAGLLLHSVYRIWQRLSVSSHLKM